MDLRALRYFVAAADAGSLNAASAAISIAQPAITRQIRQLEQDLGVELLLRTSRVVVVDRIGRRADLAISSRIFARALDIRNDARPKSTGAFIAQLRDIEQIRELLTSTTVSALVDLPFIILFLALFTMLAGPLTFVLVAALILIVVPGLLLQIPLGRLAKEGIRRIAIVNPGFSVDCIETLDEIGREVRDEFLHAGGEKFAHIPCLNDSPEGMNVIETLVRRELVGWA